MNPRSGTRVTWLLGLAALVLAALALSRALAGWGAQPLEWAIGEQDFQARIELSSMDALAWLALAGGVLLAALLVLGLVLPLGLAAGLAGLLLAGLLVGLLLGGVAAVLVGLPLLVLGLVAALLLAPLWLLAWPLLRLLRWLLR